MAYDDRSIKPMSASLMRARIATRLLAGMYENAPTLLTSAIRLSVELPGASRSALAADRDVVGMAADQQFSRLRSDR